MLQYILIIVLVLALFARITGKSSDKTLFGIAVVILILYCALRDGFLYPDIQNYYDYFNHNNSDIDFEENFNLGYSLLNRICRGISPSFQFLLSVISIIIIYLYSKAIKNYSPNIWFSLILFILINYYPSFFLLRQYLAMGVYLFSIKYIIKREPVNFGICMLIAVSFHTTATIAIPMYFLYGVNNNKWNMILLFIGSIIAIAAFYSFSTYVSLFSDYYANYFEAENEDSAWQRAIMKIYIFMVYLFTMGDKYYDKGINRVIFYSMIMNVIICVAAMNVFGVFRLREYFSLADFIGIPIMLKEAIKKKTFKTMSESILLIIYMILLTISFYRFIDSENMNNAYRFFWDTDTPF